jgi:hypothetical protein
MTEPTTPPEGQSIRPDRRVYVYFSKESWQAMQRLTGNQKGSLSQTINALIMAEDKRQNPELYE